MNKIVYDISKIPLDLNSLKFDPGDYFEHGGEFFAIMDDINEEYTWTVPFSELDEHTKVWLVCGL